MAEETKYTLAEARLVLARERCADGHTALTEVIAGGRVVKIVCDDCDQTYVLRDS